MELLAGMILMWAIMRFRREHIIHRRLHDIIVLQDLERTSYKATLVAYEAALATSAALIDKLKEVLLQRNEGVDTSRDLERSMLKDALDRETKLHKAMLDRGFNPDDFTEE